MNPSVVCCTCRMAETACVKRLQKEFRALCKEPVPNVVARPSPSDILEWHYVLEGSEGTPFAGGVYHGKVKFPPEYPYKPPGISMITPNGRFATHKRICMSMSDYHPETWNPMWSVSSILTGLLSFMMDNSPTTGSVSTTVADKQRLAKASLAFNCKSSIFRKMFPEYAEKYSEQQKAENMNSELTSNKGDAKPSTTVAQEQSQAIRHNDKETGHKGPKRGRSKNFPTWLLVLLMAVFGSVMALPLLNLDLTNL